MLKPKYIIIIILRKVFICFFYRISHSMLSSNQDTPVVLNSTGASSFPNYAVCSKLSTCSSCIEAEVIFYSAPAITSASGSCIEEKIHDWELCVSELRILLPGLRCWTPRGLLRRCQLRLPCRIRQVCLESKSCGIIMPDRGSGSDSEKISVSYSILCQIRFR